MLKSSRRAPWRARASVCCLLAMVALAGVVAAPASAAPAGRGYEVVSPAAKNGGSVHQVSAHVRAAHDGEAAAFGSRIAFEGAPGTGFLAEYLSQRETGAWTSRAITPQQDTSSFVDFLTAALPAFDGEFSADLNIGIYHTMTPLTPDTPVLEGVGNLFRASGLREPAGPAWDLVTAPEIPIGPEPIFSGYRPRFVGASADFSHVLFESTKNLTADAPAQPSDCTDFGFNCQLRLYEWVEGAGVRLAGILPPEEGGGAAPSSQAGRGGTARFYTTNSISTDGSRVIFTAPAGGTTGQLYMRVDGTTTVRINASEKTVPDPTPSPAQVLAISPDGTKVAFQSSEQLTDDAPTGDHLYLYDSEAPAGSRLSVVSEDEDPSDGLGTSNINGVAGMSDDGATVYFLAFGGRLTADATGGDNLYVWRDGTVRQIAAFNVNTDIERVAGMSSWSLGPKLSRVTPDGSTIAFVSSGGPDLPFDHGNGCVFNATYRPCQEVYVYDADANGGAGEVACASCSPTGTLPRSDATISVVAETLLGPGSSHLNHPLTDDGSLVFFSTGEGLVPDDRNGRYDVYEYDIDAGEVRLLSSGRGLADAYFMDASVTGDDVFFTTRERLVGWDTDNQVDLYDVRVGGGFPEPVAPAPPCASVAACRGGAVAPAVPTTGSVAFTGPGNVVDADEDAPAFSVKRLTARQLRRLVATGRVTLRVRVSDPGDVLAQAKARIGKRVRTVAGGAKTARRGGTVRIGLRLSKAARRELRRDGLLRLSISVAYSQVGGIQYATLTLGGRR